MAGNTPDKLLKWVRLLFSHVNYVPQLQKSRQSRTATSTLEDHRDYGTASSCELHEYRLYLEFLPWSRTRRADEYCRCPD